jgi:hypothetical protein
MINSKDRKENGAEITDIFSTATLTLAAYLHSKGYNFLDADKANGDTVFRFEDSDRLRDDVRQFRLGKAGGNINEYESSRRHMISLVKGG